MQFEVYYVLESDIGLVEVPNRNNPVEATCLRDVLIPLAEQLPKSFYSVRSVGVRVLEVAEPPTGETEEE